jgi:cytochrome c1
MRALWTSAAALAAVVAIGGTVAVNHSMARADARMRAQLITGGSADRGRSAFMGKGCGGCHALKHVPQATGLVGPPLDGVGQREIIAGKLENTPDNLMLWIAAPQSVVPGTAMPNLPLTQQDARDIAAFLYFHG